MKEEAKLILSAYRPHGQDADDPTFAEPLAAAAEDPALAAWLDEQQSFDRQVAERLAEVPIPAGLRERILAGGKVSRQRQWWQWPQFWAVAAAITIMVAVAPHFAPPKRQVAEWQKHALGVLDDLEAGKVGFEHEGKDSTTLTAWLKDHSAPMPKVPAKLASTETWGCKMWTWQGQRISLMCFKAGAKGVHLFTTERAALANAPREGRPEFARYGQWFVASWSVGANTHMLAGLEGEPMLRELIVSRGVPKPVAALAWVKMPVVASPIGSWFR